MMVHRQKYSSNEDLGIQNTVSFLKRYEISENDINLAIIWLCLLFPAKKYSLADCLVITRQISKIRDAKKINSTIQPDIRYQDQIVCR